MPIRLCVLLLCAGLLAAATAQWTDDPHRNGSLPAVDLPFDLSGPGTWRAEFRAGYYYSRPTIVADRIVFGGDLRCLQNEAMRDAAGGRKGGSVFCRSLADGSLLWELAVPMRGYAATYGVCSAPVIVADKVYLMALGDLLCLDLHGMANGNDGVITDELAYLNRNPEKSLTSLPDNCGDILWRFDIRGTLNPGYHDAPAGTVLLHDDILYVNTSHSWGTNTAIPSLIAVDAQTGALVGRAKVDIPYIFHGQWSSPCLAFADGEPRIVWGDGYGVLHAFAPVTPRQDGGVVWFEPIWSTDCNPPDYRERDGKPILYTAKPSEMNKYPKLDWVPMDKEQHRRGGPCEIIATPVYHGGLVYIGIGRDCYYSQTDGRRKLGPGQLLCIDPVDGGVVWSDRDIGRLQASAAIADGLLYTADTAGYLECRELATGERLWQVDLEAKVACRSILLADGKVYVGTDAKEIFVCAAGRAAQILGRYETEDVIATPTASDGVLILASKRGIIAY